MLGTAITSLYQQETTVLVSLNRHAASCAFDLADLLANVPMNYPFPDDLRILTTEICSSPEVRGNTIGFSFMLSDETEHACIDKLECFQKYVMSRIYPGMRKVHSVPSEQPYVIEQVFVGATDPVLVRSTMFGARRNAANTNVHVAGDDSYRFAA